MQTKTEGEKQRRISPLARFYQTERRFLPGLGLIVLMAALSGLLTGSASRLWGEAADFGVARQFGQMFRCALLMAGFLFLDALRTWILYGMIGKVTEGMMLDLRCRLFSSVTEADYLHLVKSAGAGDFMTRFSGDLEHVGKFAAGETGDYLQRIFKAVTAAYLCIQLQPLLALIYLILLPILVLFSHLFSGPLQEASSLALRKNGEALTLAHESQVQWISVQAFGLEQAMEKRYADRIHEAALLQLQVEKRAAVIKGVKYLTTTLQLLVLFLGGALLISRGQMSAGELLSFIALSAYISECADRIDLMMISFRKANAACGRVFEVLDLDQWPERQPAMRLQRR
ncbi:MAG: ABC transporter ATP-binding protein [Firmicutes bacterium]|nr:ABC transporter ATP-binding protein [Bacillota bacterium]